MLSCFPDKPKTDIAAKYGSVSSVRKAALPAQGVRDDVAGAVTPRAARHPAARVGVDGAAGLDNGFVGRTVAAPLPDAAYGVVKAPRAETGGSDWGLEWLPSEDAELVEVAWDRQEGLLLEVSHGHSKGLLPGRDAEGQAGLGLEDVDEGLDLGEVDVGSGQERLEGVIEDVGCPFGRDE